MSDMWNDPESYFNGTAPLDVTGFIKECAQSTCSDKSDWDSFMWYDDLHPSEQTSRNIAKEFVEVISGNSTYAEYWSS